MPADRRHSSFVAKPIKTERTHEENQERAYIAASRRSDRSLEARIESARRASEIHKKRTGRGLRVTEKDVINEEMYEEEDDDLPTQYQRLNAHLRTTSFVFNQRLKDYIATQHGVRDMFYQQQFAQGTMYPMSQYQPPNDLWPMENQTVFAPQTYSPATFECDPPPTLHDPALFQQQPHYQPQQQQQGTYRQSPYSIPNHGNMHQRSASISTLLPSNAMHDNKQMLPNMTPDADANRRMSLPQKIPEQQPSPDVVRPSSTITNSAGTTKQPSPTSSRGPESPHIKSENNSPTQDGFLHASFDDKLHLVDSTPLSLSLPPESQQIVGPTLDPRDPRTKLLMAGSDNLAQPFTGMYTYNPNLSPKSARYAKGANQSSAAMPSAGMDQTLAPDTNMGLNMPAVSSPGSNSLAMATMDDGSFVHPTLDYAEYSLCSDVDYTDLYLNWGDS